VNRAEWNHVLDTEPATPNQRGAIMRECGRLGLADRAERLAILAALAGIDALGSTADLTMGQAGQLVNLLQHTTDRSALPDPATATGTGDDGQDHDATGGISIAEAIGRIVLAVALAVHGRRLANWIGPYGPEYTAIPRAGGFPAQGRANSSA
jgi:hypothetical protein